ncbi:hypothetical protein ACGFYV_09200 [Streptomyces sp. NPDC048297]
MTARASSWRRGVIRYGEDADLRPALVELTLSRSSVSPWALR